MGESRNRGSPGTRRVVRKSPPRIPGSNRESWCAPARARRGRAIKHAQEKTDLFPRLSFRPPKTHAPEAMSETDDNGGRRRQYFSCSIRAGYRQYRDKRGTESI